MKAAHVKLGIIALSALGVGVLAWSRRGGAPAWVERGADLFSLRGVPGGLRLYGGESLTFGLDLVSTYDGPLEVRVVEISCGCTAATLSNDRLTKRGDVAVLSLTLDRSTLSDGLTSSVTLEGRALDGSGLVGRVTLPLYADVDRSKGFPVRGVVDGLVCDLNDPSPLEVSAVFYGDPGWNPGGISVYSSVDRAVQMQDVREGKDGSAELRIGFDKATLEASGADEVAGIVSVVVTESGGVQRSFTLILRARVAEGYTVDPRRSCCFAMTKLGWRGFLLRVKA